MASQATDRARRYYDETHSLYVEHLGYTCQAGVVGGLHRDPYRSTVLHALAESGVGDGTRILDAGCGAGGPCVYMGQTLREATIVAVTISGVQARCAHELVAREELANRIDVMVADYHRLPIVGARFDATFFFESTGYSDDLKRLFAEAFRVTKAGGLLYIKDVFCKTRMTDHQRAQLAQFNAIYAQTTRTADECADAVRATGFQDVETKVLPEATTKLFDAAMWERRGETTVLSSFGRRHYYKYDTLPVLFAQIVGRKPTASV